MHNQCIFCTMVANIRSYSVSDTVILDPSHSTSAEEPPCTIDDYLLVDQIGEEREDVIEIVRTLLPVDLPSLRLGEGSSEQTYMQLAEFFKHSTSPKGRAKFITAMDEIYIAYSEECSGAITIPDRDKITELANAFKELMKGLSSITAESLTQARSIYAKFLCYNERGAVLPRTKRQVPVGIPPVSDDDSYNATKCDCPGHNNITEPCHFFACLGVSETKFICGFGNDRSGTPCIGFIVDTTGSMAGEIAAAKRVILQFLKSQADSTVCYLLVPFNDYDDYFGRGYTEEDRKWYRASLTE